MAEQSNPGQKALLIGIAAALVGAGLGAYVHFGSEIQTPDTAITGPAAKAESLTEKVDAMKVFLSKSRDLRDHAPKGLTIDGKPRVTPMLFSPELWQVTLDAKKQNRVIDIYDASAASIHAPIPNAWFIQNGLFQELGRADGAMVDSDNDGFSNLEEFEGGTKPMEALSYPALVTQNKAPKLVVKTVDTSSAVLTAEAMLASETTAPEEVGVRIYAKPGDVNAIRKLTLKKGDQFGVSNKAPKRFTFLGCESREFVDYSGSANPEMALKVLDSSAPEGAQEFIIRAGKPRVNDKDTGTPNEKGRIIKDTVVVFEVTAGSKKGTPEATFSVLTTQPFTIPGGDKTQYIVELEGVSSNGSVNICELGKKGTTINIPKSLINKKATKDNKK